MEPQSQLCHNPDCAARGRVGEHIIKVHSRKEGRYRCHVCKRTPSLCSGQAFLANKGTVFYRLQTTAAVVTIVLALLSHGCPLRAIVVAFGPSLHSGQALDERTVTG